MRIEGDVAFHLVVCHAPCISAERPADWVQEWWQSLASMLGSIGVRSNVALMIDAKASLADRATRYFMVRDSAVKEVGYFRISSLRMNSVSPQH